MVAPDFATSQVRATLEVAADAAEEAVAKEARENPAVAKWLEGKQVKKQIFVKGKILNIVVA